MPIAVVGAGRFGTALAQILAQEMPSPVVKTGSANDQSQNKVVLLSTSKDVVRSIEQTRKNPRTGDVLLHQGIVATDKPQDIEVCRLVYLAVASTHVVHRLEQVADALHGGQLLVHTVGALLPPALGQGSHSVSQIVRDTTSVLRVGVLAGPALFHSLLADKFSSLVVASAFDEVTREVKQSLAKPPRMRVYTSRDSKGVEMASALSGVYTLALGVADGLGIGPGVRAVLVTRALAEATRLVVAAGGKADSVTGIAGLANVLVRSSYPTQEYSKDYMYGRRIAKVGLIGTGDITEGVRTVVVALLLAKEKGVRTPILLFLHKVLSGEITPTEAATRLAATVDSTAAAGDIDVAAQG